MLKCFAGERRVCFDEIESVKVCCGTHFPYFIRRQRGGVKVFWGRGMYMYERGYRLKSAMSKIKMIVFFVFF